MFLVVGHQAGSISPIEEATELCNMTGEARKEMVWGRGEQHEGKSYRIIGVPLGDTMCVVLLFLSRSNNPIGGFEF
jgi:hypothetical protein